MFENEIVIKKKLSKQKRIEKKMRTSHGKKIGG
jgi:hypothetical protein